MDWLQLIKDFCIAHKEELINLLNLLLGYIIKKTLKDKSIIKGIKSIFVRG